VSQVSAYTRDEGETAAARSTASQQEGPVACARDAATALPCSQPIIPTGEEGRSGRIVEGCVKERRWRRKKRRPIPASFNWERLNGEADRNQLNRKKWNQ